MYELFVICSSWMGREEGNTFLVSYVEIIRRDHLGVNDTIGYCKMRTY